MPELPEVQTVVNTLRPRLLGRKIVSIDLRRFDILSPPRFDLDSALAGLSVSDIYRRGKRIVFRLSDSNQFYVHLGMSGRLTLDNPSLPLPAHTHLILDFAGTQLRFRDPRRFGGVFWLGSDDSDDSMGPEPLTLTPAQLAKQLHRTTRAIKNALLDQHVIAGLGNIYVDESLFGAKIHPLTPANSLSRQQISQLNRSIKSTLRRALRHRGSTLRDYVDAEGGSGAFQKLHAVYDRARQPCRVCKTPIQRIVLGGRSTCFCPSCQPSK